MDKENGAHEEFDNPMAQNAVQELGFGENDSIKFADKQEKKLNNEQQDKNREDQDLQNDVQLEENEEDGKLYSQKKILLLGFLFFFDLSNLGCKYIFLTH